MAAPIIDGLITFLAGQIDANVWDGEVPRYDPNGNPIFPNATVGVGEPSVWPVVRVFMPEPGFNRTWTTENAYDDVGVIKIQLWATTRAAEEALLAQVEALFALAENWEEIELGYDSTQPLNPYYVVQMLLQSWYSGQEEGVRTATSQLLYRGELTYEVMIHGAIKTGNT